MIRTTIFTVSLLLAGCAANSGVVPVGGDTLMISKQAWQVRCMQRCSCGQFSVKAATGFPGTGKIKTDALKEAGEHCKNSDKSLEIIELDETEGPYVLGKYPRVELTFRCA